MIEAECGKNASGTLELHARKYYPTRVGPEVMFWRFEQTKLPAEAQLSYELSDTGDKCHINVQGAKDESLKALLLAHHFNDFTIVVGGVERPIARSDLPS